MKNYLLASLFVLSGQAFAASIAVDCSLMITDHVGEEVTRVAQDHKSSIFKEPIPKNVSYKLETEGASATFSWNVGYFPILHLNNHAQGIKTSNKGGAWEVYFDLQTSEQSFRRTTLRCSVDA